jgi:hypothetical protein
MPIFGGKSQRSKTQSWEGYPDKLDVTSSADVEWIKQSNDPLVWHDATLACLIFSGDPHGLVAWLVEQPALDRVTAAAMFLYRDNGVRRLRGEPVEFVRNDDKARFERMIDRLNELDSTRGLISHGIGMASAWEKARIAAIAILAEHGRAPLRILEQPIDRKTAAMPYCDIGEGELVSDAAMRRDLPFLFGK